VTGGRLPNFLIVGAMKSGTSSMAAYLRDHPQVWLPPEKELAFFDRTTRADDVDWYRACFAPARDEPAVGEATPTYMLRRESIARMADLLPAARLVVMLRHPVDRVYSHYWHWHGRMGETRPFADVVASELDRGVPEEPGRWDAEAPEGYSYLTHGHYTRQLDWLAERYAGDAIHIELFDDLDRDPVASFRRVCRHIGIDDSLVPESVGSVANPYKYYHPRWLWGLFVRVRIGRWLPARAGAAIYRAMVREGSPYPPMPADVRERLLAHYAPERDRLQRRLGRDLSAWAS
jgi:hypothetical protein